MYYVYQTFDKKQGAPCSGGTAELPVPDRPQEGGAHPKAGAEARHPARAYGVRAVRESPSTSHSWMKRSLPLVSTTSIILSSSLWRMNASPTPFPSIR